MEFSALIGPRIRQLCNAFDQAANRGAEAYGLTGLQTFIIGTIARREGELCAKDFERRLKLRHSTISGVLQRLEIKGFIQTVSDAEDRRIKRLKLTAKGKDICELARQKLDGVEETLTKDFTPEEREQFIWLLDKALQNIRQAHLPDTMFLEKEDEDNANHQTPDVLYSRV